MTSLTLARDADDFLRDPLGRVVSSSSWLYAWLHPRLSALVLRGEPRPRELLDLDQLLRRSLAPSTPRHAKILDVRRLEGLPPLGFEVFVSYVEELRAQLRAKVERLAIVRPTGLFGAAAEGFFDLVEAPYPVAIFSTIGEALAWVGEDPAAADTLDQLGDDGTPALLRELRAFLRANLGKVDVARAARALGVSPRSLQRQLNALGTSYRNEMQLAQVRAAERLLVETNDSLAVIAYAIGCATPAHFSDLFRRVRGVTPTQWRTTHSNVARGT